MVVLVAFLFWYFFMFYFHESSVQAYFSSEAIIISFNTQTPGNICSEGGTAV
jgi:multidrug resistance efflux pump